jgi:hypothetical protein
MEPRDPTADPTPTGDPPPGALDLALIAIVAALLIVPALT